MADACEDGSKTSVYMKGGKFQNWLNDCYFLRDADLWSFLVSLKEI